MSRTARSGLVFGIYLLVLGALLVAVPNLVLRVFGLPTTEEVWIRVVGVLVLALGYYYVQAARHELRAFFPATVVARFALLGFFIAFVLLEFVKPVLILFGAIDALGATWTAWALTKDAGAA